MLKLFFFRILCDFDKSYKLRNLRFQKVHVFIETDRRVLNRHNHSKVAERLLAGTTTHKVRWSASLGPKDEKCGQTDRHDLPIMNSFYAVSENYTGQRIYRDWDELRLVFIAVL